MSVFKNTPVSPGRRIASHQPVPSSTPVSSKTAPPTPTSNRTTMIVFRSKAMLLATVLVSMAFAWSCGYWCRSFFFVLRQHEAEELCFSTEPPSKSAQKVDSSQLLKDRSSTGSFQPCHWESAPYYEALVHPTMFAQDSVDDVAILGGVATLREVLKHKDVKNVHVITTATTYFANCSDLVLSGSSGSISSCFDDPRVKVIQAHPINWIIENYGERSGIDGKELYDVIIVESASLFKHEMFGLRFIDAMSNALERDGFFAAPVDDDDDDDDKDLKLVELLELAGLESVLMYEEAHARPLASSLFLTAMNDEDSRIQWYANEAHVALAMHQRSVGTHSSGDTLFRYFDGATMESYQRPPHRAEDRFCARRPEKCRGGHGFVSGILNFPQSSFEVKPSKLPHGGRGVFAKEFIPKGSYIGLNDCVHGMFVPPLVYQTTLKSAIAWKGMSKFWESLFWGYFEGYGWTDTFYGNTTAGIDPGLFTFVNHGCGGTYNIGEKCSKTEATIDPEDKGVFPASTCGIYNSVYNPFDERHQQTILCKVEVALRDINEGEELLSNYLAFSEDDFWKENVKELKEMCSGGIGRVSAYEGEEKI